MKNFFLDTKLLKQYINKLSNKEGNVELFIYNSMREEPVVFDKKKIAAINAICRKIDIVKNIYKEYDSEWKLRKSNYKIRKEVWVPLVSLIMLYLIKKTYSKELKLCLLNSIFNAYEIMKKENIMIPLFLEDCSEKLLLRVEKDENY